MSENRQTVVTGIGQYSSLGRNVEEFWQALIAARSGIRPLNVPDRIGNGLGAPLIDSDAGCSDGRLKYALQSCILEALTHAALQPPDMEKDLSFPIVLGSNFGDVCTISDNGDFFHTVRMVLTDLGLYGEVWGVSVACASGVGALGIACDLIKFERAQRVLVCAYDVITPYIYSGLASLRAISPDTIRPFDKRRNGTLLGEAAVCVIVESKESACSRRVPIPGEVLGYGISNDAYHFTAPEPSGIGMRSAMSQALQESGLSAGDIDHLNAHGTGTPQNDRIETLSVRSIFGDFAKSIPITSIKASVGHTMGAAGALEFLATLLSVKNEIVPPTLNHQEHDPDCDLDYVFHSSRNVAIRAAMNNSYGLWGCNSSMIVGRGEGNP